MTLVLHGYWRSTASYRVRIALALKGLAFEQVTHDLRLGGQRAPDYLAVAPQGLVPALTLNGEAFTQSMAIIELLDERHPEPPLLPPDAEGRAHARGIAAAIACDIHPLHNLRVLTALRQEFSASEAQVQAWIARWIGDGLAAIEPRILGPFALGEAPGLVDCVLVPQVYAARRFAVDLQPFPRLTAAADHAAALPAIQAAHPDRQPDA